MKISASILSARNRITAVKNLNRTDIDYLHLDVMDGSFVRNKQFTFSEINKIATVLEKKMDVHLMVDNPIHYLKKIALLNIEYVTIHLEIKKDIKKIINEIRKYGFKVGLSIKPNTDSSLLLPYIDDIDLVLIMSVEPGLGGQQFITKSLDKALEVKNIIKEKTIIEMDGGINNTNIDQINNYPVDMIVVGSFITNSNNYQEQINKLKK